MNQPTRIIPSLGTYLADAANAGIIDHVVRVRQHGHGNVNVYIRPMNADGQTLGYVIERGLAYPDPAVNGMNSVAADEHHAPDDTKAQAVIGHACGTDADHEADYRLVAKVAALGELIEKNAQAVASAGLSGVNNNVAKVIDAMAKRILKDMGEEVSE